SVLVGFMLLGSQTMLSAQHPDELMQLIETAYKQNLQLKQSGMDVQAVEQLKGTSWNLPKTNFMGEFGQFNSFESDTKFGIEQDFEFPSIYMNRSDVFSARIKQNKADYNVKQTQLKAKVIQLYYEWKILARYQKE